MKLAEGPDRELEWSDLALLTCHRRETPDGPGTLGQAVHGPATARRAWPTNPATGQPWTTSEVNALQAGIENVYLSATTRVTQVYVTVALGSGASYTYGPMNELLTADGSDAATFTYTANGSLATKTAGGVTWTYAYNGLGLLASVKQGTTTVAQYFYDGLGRRVKAVEGSTTTYSVYGLGIDPIWEKAGTTETRHVYANGMRIARMTGSGSSWTTYYYHSDALGSTWRSPATIRGMSSKASPCRCASPMAGMRLSK